MNEGHPLDWYPEDEPESRSIEEAEAWVDSVLTRREEAENMVKLHEARQALATPDGLYTTTPAKEIVMPSQRTTPSIMAAVQSVARQLQENPLPPRTATKPLRQSVRRGAVRAADDLPWLCVPSLYFMQCTVCHLVKIGVSGDYRLRRIELQKTTGHQLVVLGFDYGDMEIEASVHRYFSLHRATGEWYRPTGAILKYARRLRHQLGES